MKKIRFGFNLQKGEFRGYPFISTNTNPFISTNTNKRHIIIIGKPFTDILHNNIMYPVTIDYTDYTIIPKYI